jgi:hypothetical protein
VTAVERTKNTPAGTHSSEMAEKRAIARASRMAFGQDVPDEDELGITEVPTPADIQAGAATYDRIYGHEDDPLPASDRLMDSTPIAPTPEDTPDDQAASGVELEELPEFNPASSGVTDDSEALELDAWLEHARSSIAAHPQANHYAPRSLQIEAGNVIKRGCEGDTVAATVVLQSLTGSPQLPHMGKGVCLAIMALAEEAGAAGWKWYCSQMAKRAQVA